MQRERKRKERMDRQDVERRQLKEMDKDKMTKKKHAKSGWEKDEQTWENGWQRDEQAHGGEEGGKDLAARSARGWYTKYGCKDSDWRTSLSHGPWEDVPWHMQKAQAERGSASEDE